MSGVLPAVIVFGLGLTLVVAPVTATVMAAADERHSGIASGINTAVSRLSGLIIVAVLPLIAGLTGSKFYETQTRSGRPDHHRRLDDWVNPRRRKPRGALTISTPAVGAWTPSRSHVQGGSS